MSDTCTCPICQRRRIVSEARGRASPPPDAAAIAAATERRNAAIYADFLRDNEPEITHAGQCRLINNQTGEPLSNFPYTIVLEDGQEISGVTNIQGYTTFIQVSGQPHLKVRVPT
jgi:hypothetical protein